MDEARPHILDQIKLLNLDRVRARNGLAATECAAAFGKPRMLVAIALANKMARQIWAMLTKNEAYRDPTLVMAA